MAIKRFQEGTGLTKRDRVKVTLTGPMTEEEVEAIGHMLTAHDRFKEIGDVCTRILERAGLPADPLAYGAVEMASKRPAKQSPEWYALRLLNHIRVLTVALKRNDAHITADLALDIGLTWQEAVFKFSWESDAILGQARRKTQSSLGKKGAELRWGNESRHTIDGLIERLRGPAYEDWKAKEKWDVLIGLMDVERLNPIETWIKSNDVKSTLAYDGDRGKPLTYGNFKNRLSK